MTTTLKKAIDAYRILSDLNNIRMKYTATSRKLFNLKLIVKPALEFCNDEELKLVNEIGGKIMEDGTILFNDQKTGMQKFSEGQKELWKSEWDIPLDIPVVFHDDEGVEVSGNDIELLQELGLARFEE